MTFPPEGRGAGESKLPPTLRVWACLLPFRLAAASVCLVHSAVASCHSLSHLALWVSDCLEMSKKPKPACPPASASHSSQPVKEHNLVAMPAAVWDQGLRHAAVRSHSKPQQAFDFRLPSFFNGVFHSSEVAWLEEPMPTLILVWRLHLSVVFCFIATHHPL